MTSRHPISRPLSPCHHASRRPSSRRRSRSASPRPGMLFESLEARQLMAADFDLPSPFAHDTHDHGDHHHHAAEMGHVDAGFERHAVDGQEHSFYADPYWATDERPEPSVLGPQRAGHPLSSVPRLNSNPSAGVTLYLDFDGHYEPTWGTFRNVLTPAWDMDGDRTTFSDAELTAITNIWRRVAEDYAPFNVNVSTVEPSSFANGVSLRAAIGGSYRDWFEPQGGGPAGGVGYVNSFTSAIPNVVYAFTIDPEDTAEVTSHELGHGLGLHHQSAYNQSGQKVEEYYSGNSVWAPIMGNSYNKTVTTWYNGPNSQGPNNYQDDMAIIAGQLNGFGYRQDDHPNTPGTARPLTVSGSTATAQGIIERMDDVDVFSFGFDGGEISLQVSPLAAGPNLNIHVTLRDSNGQVVTSGDPQDSLGAVITGTLSAGNYTLTIAGSGQYGIVGQYAIEGSGAFRSSGGGGGGGGGTGNTGRIDGRVWNDTDGDGNFDSNEQPLAGWTVYLDQNNNGQLDSSETRLTTANDGSYSFQGLANGRYYVGHLLPQGWEQTYPRLSNAAARGIDAVDSEQYRQVASRGQATGGGSSLHVLADDTPAHGHLQAPPEATNQAESNHDTIDLARAEFERIVGGNEATPGEWPWMVSVQYVDQQNQASHFCGGSLIDDQWVLTAAHCVKNIPVGGGQTVNLDESQLRVILGRHALGSGQGETRGVTQIIAHANYQNTVNGSDIALLRLDSPSQQPVVRLASAADQSLFAPGRQATVTGWGALTQGGSSPDRLQEVVVPIVSNQTANQPQAYGGLISDSMLAAGYSQGGRDSCQGDSGGPLVVADGSGGFVQAGIVSWGEGCAQPDKYGIYTRVASFYDWVDSRIPGGLGGDDGGGGSGGGETSGDVIWVLDIGEVQHWVGADFGDRPTSQPSNDPPDAVNDRYDLQNGQTLNVSAASGVLANDRDPDGDALSVLSLVTDVRHGTLTLRTDGSFTYQHNGSGQSDSFVYRVSDGQLQDDATVTLSVQAEPPSDGPFQVVRGVSSEVHPTAGGTVRVPLRYDVTDGDNTLTGLTLRVHYDSSKLQFSELSGALAGFNSHQVHEDRNDLDRDPATDRFVNLLWADLNGNWPNTALPADLVTVVFALQGTLNSGASTPIRFTGESSVSHDFRGEPIEVTAGPAITLDIDGDGTLRALSDGILAIRYLAGFSGEALTRGAVGNGATRATADDIIAYLDAGRQSMLDVDGNGSASALSDGILLLRYLAGFSGSALTGGAVAQGASRDEASEIIAFLDGFRGPASALQRLSDSLLAAASAASQNITPSPAELQAAAGDLVQFDVRYDTSNAQRTAGLTLRMHFDSSKLQYRELTNLLGSGSAGQQVSHDTRDLDNDPSTDRYVNLLWVDINGNWPADLPARLFTANFLATEQLGDGTRVNFTGESAIGFELDVQSVAIDGRSAPAAEQFVSGSQSQLSAAPGGVLDVGVQYQSPQAAQGLGLRLHFDSSALTFQQFEGLLPHGLIATQGPQADSQDFDHDPATDQFVTVAWADVLNGNWPGQAGVTSLFTARFEVSEHAAAGSSTAIRFSSSSHDPRQTFASEPINVQFASPATLDVDGNGVADALSDGMMIVRYLSGVRGDALVLGTADPQGTRITAAEVESYLAGARSSMLDVDGNGAADAATDGNLILRYLFGFRGPSLVTGLPLAGSRTTADQVADFLDQFQPDSPGATTATGDDAAQQLTTSPARWEAAPGERIELQVGYDQEAGGQPASGLGLRLHYNSADLQLESVRGTLDNNLVAVGQPQADDLDHDQDPATDMYVLVAWSDTQQGRWTSGELTEPLLTASFLASDSFRGETRVSLSRSSGPLGWDLQSEGAEVRSLHGWTNPMQSVDVNGDGKVTPVDVLHVVNAINSQGSGLLPELRRRGDALLDANGDGRLTPADALSVINHLNSGGRSTPLVAAGSIAGEGERHQVVATDLAGQPNHLPPSDLPAMDRARAQREQLFSQLAVAPADEDQQLDDLLDLIAADVATGERA
ncbi:MAG: trypsin-like serine protease [Pirellulaceae bacterium]|nr:trypsin-like serine protease [Pirellulaceae bacterium]